MDIREEGVGVAELDTEGYPHCLWASRSLWIPKQSERTEARGIGGVPFWVKKSPCKSRDGLPEKKTQVHLHGFCAVPHGRCEEREVGKEMQ